jgi:hypothetical protein
MLTSENISTLQPAGASASSLNPCQCPDCTMTERVPDVVDEGPGRKVLSWTTRRISRPGYTHWWCDVCGKGPFDRGAGQRPVYQRNVLNANNELGSIRYACSGGCAQSEQLSKLREAKDRKMRAGDLDGAKQITMEVQEMTKERPKPERKPE